MTHGPKGAVMQWFKRCKPAALPAMLAALLATAGCSSMHRHADAAAESNPSNPDVVFPDPSHAMVPEGTFVNLENLRKVAPGMTKRQLYALLGAPHFDEGVFAVHKWNYVFDFRKADGSNNYFSCQYQIAFDRHGLASDFYWKPEACKSVLDVQAPAAVAPAPAPEALPKEPIRLSSDALFDFDRAELTAQGHEQLDQLLQKIRSASQVENIMIAGYTDRIGSDRYNLALSRRRAEAVRDYLVQGGVPAAAMQVDGRGKADPVVQCNDASRAKLIACLAPNRRVELSGVAKPGD